MTTTQTTDTLLTRVALVMVTFESAATVAASLAALPLDRLADAVVVDNASRDASADLARAAGARVITRTTNAGFGSAVDQGIDTLAGAPYVLVLNPDAVITPDNLARLVRYLEDHERCALVGPRLYRDDTPLTSAGRPASLLTELRLVTPAFAARRLPDRRAPASFATTGPVGYVEGACVLLRRDAVAAAGGFGPGWFLFYEELDLARRLGRRGLTVDLCADARADHAVAVSRASTPLGARPMLFGATNRYLRRWHGAMAAATFRVSARATWWIRSRRGSLSDADRRQLVKGLHGGD